MTTKKTKKKMKKVKVDEVKVDEVKMEQPKKVNIPSPSKLFNLLIKKKPTKLVNLKLLKKYYDKTLSYLKSLNQEELSNLEQQLSNKNIDIQKKNIIINILEGFTKKPKKNITRTKLKKRNPNKKGKYKCFTDYTVINELGAGIFGTTYLTEKNNKKYAVKEISIQKDIWSLSPDIQMKNIENEIEIATILGKMNISPKVYETYICKEGGVIKAYIVMEYMSEGTLFTWLDSNTLTPTHKKQIHKKVNKMHSLKYVHNDLHLNNVFVTKKNNKIEFYIGDLGLSYNPKNMYKKLFEFDINRLEEDFMYKFSSKYNFTIASLFVIWRLL